MRKFWKRRNDHKSSERPKEKKKTGKWRRFATATLLLGSLFLQPKFVTPTSKPESSQLSYFEMAQRNSELRQAYLDELMRELDNECVAGIVYDPTGEITTRNHQQLIEYYERQGLGNEISEEERELGEPPCGVRNRHGVNAYVSPGLSLEWGDGIKQTIYVCPRIFSSFVPEERLRRLITVHETTHACDKYGGIRVGGEILITGDQIREMDPVLVRLVLEIRGHGNEIRNISVDGDWTFDTPNNFLTYYDALGRLLNIKRSERDDTGNDTFSRVFEDVSLQDLDIEIIEGLETIHTEYNDVFVRLITYYKRDIQNRRNLNSSSISNENL